MTAVRVNCGYLPLVDCAPLIIARELRFAAQEGLDLTLVKQPSWSALRDMLAFGQIDFAHMLSPMPVAMSLGLGGMAFGIDVLMVLSVNGTTIGVSGALERAMRATGWTNDFDDPHATSRAIFAAGTRRLRIGVPFVFSVHRMLLETWLSDAPGFSPDRIEIVTVPPPKMADAVSNGALDMFCVGEPWGSVAVQQSGAALILPGTRIWEFSPEKVLGVQRARSDAASSMARQRCLDRLTTLPATNPRAKPLDCACTSSRMRQSCGFLRCYRDEENEHTQMVGRLDGAVRQPRDGRDAGSREGRADARLHQAHRYGSLGRRL